MKKAIIAIFAVAVIVVVLVACVNIFSNNTNQSKVGENSNNSLASKNENLVTNDETNQVVKNDGKQENDNEKTETNSKNLVVIFSRADENYRVGDVEKGNTMFLAEYIKEELNADLFEIVPTNKYPADYDECTKVAQEELRNNSRPKYNGDVSNWEDYDNIFLGYPIWWGDLPMCCYTFIENHDFTGKNVYIFNTHEGSGNAGTASSLKSKISGANVNTDYLAMTGTSARENGAKLQVQNWLKRLGF